MPSTATATTTAKVVKKKDTISLVFKRVDWEKMAQACGSYKKSFIKKLDEADADIRAKRVYSFEQLKKLHKKLS